MKKKNSGEEKPLSKKELKKQAKLAEIQAKKDEKIAAKLEKKNKRKGRGKRIGKRLLVLLVVGGVLYGAYLFLLKPNGFTSGGDNVTSFITNIDDTKVCNDHFNTETTTICETFIESLDGSVVELEEARDLGDKVRLHLIVDGNDVFFDVTFITYEPGGLRSILGGDYYKIDLIE